ncbi:2-aminoethylphosphonate--pyruvate transaminase-like [Gigantopelta aegis]|uniref:2-aminoethylphosphonate--pyruvate transaminase-like n=1 Tax=Gigantopelta aegis TaxID=1735272 RepID=UPI001B88A00A|nr:2-aminoethylphosphonate--pyruvate transaminase-like [Gigantopelta aegis]
MQRIHTKSILLRRLIHVNIGPHWPQSSVCVRSIPAKSCVASASPILFQSNILTFRNFAASANRFNGKKLFTPGPLGTSMTVKQAMLKDLGSRDVEFIQSVKDIRSKLLQIAGVSSDAFTCIPLQGSGTFAVEAVLQTTVPRQQGKVLIAANGAYGNRMGKICETVSIPYQMESFAEDSAVEPSRIEEVLKADNSFTHVCIVHCETSSGVFNPVEQVGKIVKKYIPNASYFVDAMSSFGAVPLNFSEGHVDYLVTSANKCLEGVPGFSIVIANKQKLAQCKGVSRSLSLDLFEQDEGLNNNGQFRFTPATHSMLAFKQAIVEYEAEGGLTGRSKRYQENREILRKGMARLGFKELLDEKISGYIITSYHYPKDTNFDFKDFYNRLNEKGDVIYPGKVLKLDCFRIGNIGHLYRDDMKRLLTNIEDVCRDMKISLPVKN